MYREWDQNIAPRLDQGYARLGGTFSSRRGLARQDSLDELTSNLSSGLNAAQLQNQQMNAQLYNQAADRQLQGVQLMEMLANAPATRGSAMTQALNPFQQYAQMQAQSQFEEFMRMAPENDPWARLAAGSIGSQPTIQTTQGTDYASMIGSIAGVVAAPFSGGASLALTAGLAANKALSGNDLIATVPGPNPY